MKRNLTSLIIQYTYRATFQNCCTPDVHQSHMHTISNRSTQLVTNLTQQSTSNTNESNGARWEEYRCYKPERFQMRWKAFTKKLKADIVCVNQRAKMVEVKILRNWGEGKNASHKEWSQLVINITVLHLVLTRKEAPFGCRSSNHAFDSHSCQECVCCKHPSQR